MYMLSVFRFLKINESPKDPNVILIVPCKCPIMLSEVVQVRLLRPESAIEIRQYTLGCACHRKRPVGVGAGWHASKPAIKDSEFFGKSINDRG
jgi:hypothetical protein